MPKERTLYSSEHRRYYKELWNTTKEQWIFSEWVPLIENKRDSVQNPASPRQGHAAAASAGAASAGLPRGRGTHILGTYTGRDTLHYEKVDPSYFVRDISFFVEGKMFSVIMSETAGEQASAAAVTDYNTSRSLTRVKYDDHIVYTNVRRFIVVKQRREYCYACPIFTYGGRATTKPGVRASEHGVVYSWGQDPALLPGETGITKADILVVMAAGVPMLDRASRIYFGIHHPIQYNVKVKDMGYVPQTHVPILIGNWREEEGDAPPQHHVEQVKSPKPVAPLRDGEDMFMYHPSNNLYGYHPEIQPNMYHPTLNSHGYHHQHNPHGHHPSSNPFSYHPKHNPYGFHPQLAPFCYHPQFSPYGYHASANPQGYHPDATPFNYHPESNPQGWHATLNAYSYHPSQNPQGYHPKLNPHSYHPTYNPQAYGKGKGKAIPHSGGSGGAAHPQSAIEEEEEDDDDGDDDDGEGEEDDDDDDDEGEELADTMARTSLHTESHHSSSLPATSQMGHNLRRTSTTSPPARNTMYHPPGRGKGPPRGKGRGY